MLKFQTRNLLTMGAGDKQRKKETLLFPFFKPDMVNKATPVIAAFCKLKQKDHGCQAFLGLTARSCFPKQKQKHF